MTIAGTLSREKKAKLDQYVALLDRWRSITNLISAQSFSEIWVRHIEDVLHLQRICRDKRVWLDIGSGAGIPAVILGIALSDLEGVRIHCVESDGRKCAFLRSVVQSLNLPLKIHQARMQSIRHEAIGRVEIVTARAFSSVKNIFALAQPYIDDGAILVLPRGKSEIAEVVGIDETRYSVRMTMNPAPSDGIILCIKSRAREL